MIALLLPEGAAGVPSLGPNASGDALYRFDARELKAVNHRLDGVFWPRSREAGTPQRPVVLLEVQLHPEVEHLAVVVVVPQQLQMFVDGVGFPYSLALHREELLMEIATIPAKDLRHTRVAQEWIEEGRLEGEARGRATEAATVTLRLLNRRCGTISEATTSRIQSLPLEQLEGLAEALLDFNGPADLAAWLEEYKG